MSKRSYYLIHCVISYVANKLLLRNLPNLVKIAKLNSFYCTDCFLLIGKIIFFEEKTIPCNFYVYLYIK